MFSPRHLYTLALYCILPFIPLRLLWRGRKQPAYLAHWGEVYLRLAYPTAEVAIIGEDFGYMAHQLGQYYLPNKAVAKQEKPLLPLRVIYLQNL